jgi:outer membrane lipoprotein-sorting protein
MSDRRVYRRNWLLLLFLLSLIPPFSGRLSAQSDYLKESEKRAREILAKSIEALGGNAYLKVQDSHRMGRFYQFRKDQLKGSTHFQLYEKFPGKIRLEMGKKGELVNINDGDKGWKVEYKVVKVQTAQEIENSKINLMHNLDYILRFRLNEPGMRFRYIGISRADNTEIEGVQLLDKDNDKIKIFVDTATFLPFKMEFRSPAVGIFDPTDDERIFYNYHAVEGVQVPYSTVRFSNGFKASEFQLESVQVDLALPDALFTPEYVKK